MTLHPTIIFLPSIGTVVTLLDPDGVVCAEGCVTGFGSLHGRAMPPEHYSVLLVSVQEGRRILPPCPSSFDDSTEVEVGGFYAWPLSRLRLS